jgi:CHAT domain-containing protein
MSGRFAALRVATLGVAWSCAASDLPRASVPEKPARTATRVAARATGTALSTSIARGESLYLHGAYDSARETWNAALLVARDARDSLSESRVLTWLGLTAWRTGDYANARALGERALALKLRLSPKSELSRSYNALGLLAWNEGRLSDATLLFQQASVAARADSDEAALGKAANNFALVAAEQGRFAEAKNGFLDARRVGLQLHDARLEGGALNNLAMLYVQMGDPQAALAPLARARQLYRSIDYATGEQNAIAQLATAHQALGEFRLAFAAIDTAIEMARHQGLRQELAGNLELAAGLYREAGEFARALQLYDLAEVTNRQLGSGYDRGINRRNAAEIHATVGRLDLAELRAGEALSLHRAGKARLEELRDHLLLADLASTAGRSADLDRHLASAESLSTLLDARSARVEIALARATIAERAGDARTTLRVLQHARRDLDRGGYAAAWQDASLRAHAFVRLSLLDSAVAAARSAVNAVERVRGQFGSAFLRHAYAANKATAYTDLVEVLLRLGRVNEAFEVADASRSRALIESLAATRADSSSRSATLRGLVDGEQLLRRADSLVSHLDALESSPPAERDTAARSLARGFATALDETRSAYEALLVRVTERDAAGAALLGSRGISVSEVRRALRPGEALLEYLVTPRRLILFVVTRERVSQLTADISRDALTDRVRLARSMLGRANADDGSDKLLRGLHESLVAPVERAGLLAGVRRLIVVPHSVLSYLPFAALVEERSGRVLVEHYAILNLPSAAALTALRGVESAAPAATTGSSTATGFAPFPRTLPGSMIEMRALARSRGGVRGIVGTDATEVRLRRALSSSGTVHIATHGLMNARNPMFSRIELARGTGDPHDDGRLEVHELLGMHIDATLVFLSGCETGLGAAGSTRFAQGEDYASLAQAFLYAGARSVVSTVWPIGDAGAAEFASRFYAHLRSESPPEALASAQRDLFRSPRYRAPYYWAAYQVIGDGR